MSTIWQNNLNKLIQFKNEFGHVNVPKSYTDKQLARLVTTIRQQKRYGTLKAERELALHQINFDFEPLNSQWTNVYNNIVEFYRLNGHASPSRRSENEHERALADWVHRMHKMIRNKELSEDKKQKLLLINIDGNPSSHKINRSGLSENFELMLNRLKNYIQEYSPIIHSKMADPILYAWVLLQQQRINASLISSNEYSVFISTGLEIEKEVVSHLKQFFSL